MPAPQNRYPLRSQEGTAQQNNAAEQQNVIDQQNNDIEQQNNVAEQQPADLSGQVATAEGNPQSHQQTVTMASGHVPSVRMDNFHGNPGERGDEWLKWYTNFAEAYGLNDNKRRLWMPFYFEDHAKVWYDALPDATKSDWKKLCDEFTARFNGTDGVASEASILNTKQLEHESCASYFTKFIRATANRNYPESILTGVVLNGLLPKIKTIVMPQDLKTVEAIRKAACLAERTVSETVLPPQTVASVSNSDKMEMLALQEQVNALQSQMEEQRKDFMKPYYHGRPYGTTYQQPSTPQRQGPPYQHQQRQQQQQQQQQRQRQESQQPRWECGRCGGRKFHLPEYCPANDKLCKKMWHCRSFWKGLLAKSSYK